MSDHLFKCIIEVVFMSVSNINYHFRIKPFFFLNDIFCLSCLFYHIHTCLFGCFLYRMSHRKSKQMKRGNMNGSVSFPTVPFPNLDPFSDDTKSEQSHPEDETKPASEQTSIMPDMVVSEATQRELSNQLDNVFSQFDSLAQSLSEIRTAVEQQEKHIDEAVSRCDSYHSSKSKIDTRMNFKTDSRSTIVPGTTVQVSTIIPTASVHILHISPNDVTEPQSISRSIRQEVTPPTPDRKDAPAATASATASAKIFHVKSPLGTAAPFLVVPTNNNNKDEKKDVSVRRRWPALDLKTLDPNVASIDSKSGVFLVHVLPTSSSCKKFSPQRCVCTDCRLSLAWCMPATYYEESSGVEFKGTNEQCEHKFQHVYPMIIRQYETSFNFYSLFECKIQYLIDVLTRCDTLTLASKMKWVEYVLTKDAVDVLPEDERMTRFIIDQQVNDLKIHLSRGLMYSSDTRISCQEWKERFQRKANTVIDNLKTKSVRDMMMKRHTDLLDALIKTFGAEEKYIDWLLNITIPHVLEFNIRRDVNSAGRLSDDVLVKMNFEVFGNARCSFLYEACGHASVTVCKQLLKWGAVPDSLCCREIMSRHKEWTFDTQKEMMALIVKAMGNEQVDINWYSHIPHDCKERLYWMNLGWDILQKSTPSHHQEFLSGIGCSIDNLGCSIRRDDCPVWWEAWKWFESKNLLTLCNARFLEVPRVPTSQKLTMLGSLYTNGWRLNMVKVFDLTSALMSGCDTIVLQSLLNARWIDISDALIRTSDCLVPPGRGDIKDSKSVTDTDDKDPSILPQLSSSSTTCRMHLMWPSWFKVVQTYRSLEYVTVERWIELGKWIRAQYLDDNLAAKAWHRSNLSFSTEKQIQPIIQWFTTTFSKSIAHDISERKKIEILKEKEEREKRDDEDRARRNLVYDSDDDDVYGYD